MIEKILDRLAKLHDSNTSVLSDDMAWRRGVKDAYIEVREVAKEYGKDTNVPSNADRIRSFSDEELAENVSCPYIATECIHLDDDIECEQCKLQWLKSEAKE